MPKELIPYLANALGIIVTDKAGDSPYKVVSQKTFTEEVGEVAEVIEKIDEMALDMGQINENAEYIRQNTENIEQLRETIEAVRNIKADVQLVEENTARISSNLEAIETNTANISTINESLSAAESSISSLESSIANLDAKDDELDLGIQSNLALIESYAEPDGEIDQHIDTKLADYVSTSSYTADQANKSAAYANLYQTKTAAAEDKSGIEERLDSLDSSVSEINGNIESINDSLSTKAEQSSVDANAESISILSAKADGLEERISENADAISSNVSSIQSNSAQISNILADVANVKTTVGQKANQSYVDEQISNTQDIISGYVSDGGVVDQKISGALESYVSSDAYSSDQETREAAYDIKYALNSNLSDLQSTVSSNSAKISNNTASIASNASAISSLQEDVEELKTIKADVEAVNENAEYIRQNAENLETLQETVENIQSIKADVEIVQENAQRIASNLEAIETNTSNIASVQERMTAAESAIEVNSSSIATAAGQISSLSSSVDANTSAISSANGKISTIEGNVASLQSDVSANAASIAAVSETAAGNETAISTLNTAVSSNTENISLTQDRVSVLENAGYLTKNSFSQGLYRLQGDTSTTSAKHTIVTKKNGKNITSMIWNESSGGGSMFTNENAGKKSFIGVNNGDGDNEIWVQGYAKRTTDNIGTRFTLTTEGMYYTKNQGNGSYTPNDEVVVKKDIADFASTSDLNGLATESYVSEKIDEIEMPDVSEFVTINDVNSAISASGHVSPSQLSGLVAVNGTNVSSASHDIVTKKNGKNLTAKIWNETSGGGAQFRNEDAGKVSFIGVNNGDGNNEIWVQGYAKNISSNLGTRITLSTNGFYYTKNQANGSYTNDDEVVVKKDLSDVAKSTDLEGLATEAFVSEKIGEVEIPDVSGFVTAEDVETAVENSGYVKPSQLAGLVSVDGTNVSPAVHTIVTKKNGKNLTAKIWNEISGGGSQFKNEDVGKISFIGVNNGDGNNEIWVQGYAKSTSTNIGTRMTLSTEGMYYTKNQSNGSYTANDEIVVKKDLSSLATESYVDEKIAGISAPDLSNYATLTDVSTAVSNSGHVVPSQLSGLVAVNGANVSSASHNIITQKNGKNLTAKIWNETSGGGAQFRNEDAGKVSFIGVNNGDGDNEIWVQGYAKNIANNTGTRIALSTEGFYYTKNQNNGSYTNLDEVLTKRDANSIRMVIDSAILDFKMQLVNAGIATLEQLGLQSGTIDPGSGSGPIEEEDF